MFICDTMRSFTHSPKPVVVFFNDQLWKQATLPEELLDHKAYQSQEWLATPRARGPAPFILASLEVALARRGDGSLLRDPYEL